MPTPTADVRWAAHPPDPRAVVLVLHGGQERSTAANSWWRVPVWWMVPFARTVRRAGGGTFAVARVLYAVRGWNDDASPLADVRAVLDEVAARYPGVPVALVGHSMGGRVALRLLDDERVTSVVGLAPWVDRSDVDAGLYRAHPGVRLLVVHGLADRITSARASRAVVRRLQARGTAASFVGLEAGRHSLIRRRLTVDRLLAAHLRATLGPDAHAFPRSLESPAPGGDHLPLRLRRALVPGTVAQL